MPAATTAVFIAAALKHLAELHGTERAVDASLPEIRRLLERAEALYSSSPLKERHDARVERRKELREARRERRWYD